MIDTFPAYMSRYKNNKKRIEQTTLEAKHKKILANFSKQRKELCEKEKLLNKIKKNLVLSDLQEKNDLVYLYHYIRSTSLW